MNVIENEQVVGSNVAVQKTPQKFESSADRRHLTEFLLDLVEFRNAYDTYITAVKADLALAEARKHYDFERFPGHFHMNNVSFILKDFHDDLEKKIKSAEVEAGRIAACSAG